MDLTIIIADSDDLRIKNCIESIDENVEILVSLNKPTKDLFSLINKLEVNYCLIEKKGLSLALNNGILHAKYDKIIIIDSDCIFEKGTIKKLFNSLDSSDMARGIQLTKYNSFLSKIISKARQFHGNTVPDPEKDEILAYKPLAYKKSIATRMGGKIYNDKLLLSEDFEMNLRRLNANIGLKFCPDAIIYHDPISLLSDLRSAFRYGKDRYTMIKLMLTKPKKNLLKSLKKIAKKCYPKYGFSVSLYMVIWTLTYDFGYWYKYFSKKNH